MVRLTRRRVAAGLLAAALLVGGAAIAVRQTMWSDPAATAARLDALTVGILGSADELRAAELVSYHRIEGGVAACMRERGTPYEPAPFFTRYDGFTDADLGYGTGRAGVLDSVTEHGRRFITNVLGQARMPAGYHERGAPAGVDPDTWAAAVNACRAPYEYRDYHDFTPPTGAYELSDLPGLSSDIYANPLVRLGMLRYSPCMADLGYRVEWHGRDDFLFRDWGLRLEDAPVDGRAAAPAWNDAVAALTSTFAADAKCRDASYRPAMRLLASRLDQWEAAHRDQLAAIRAEWRSRVAAAAGLPTTLA
ncbi:hypothetical protein QEZ54_10965 [Catellatospora sp. KI3]|uniref:hypothetical protein n=1 Tax=Catellatospora sp. KI3 TaxID=3041620 RepID=UPI002482429F|nr:hypothetical protein [Catellatospora sp. KI3]MDI1461492.1 hypothetical protein [Catellatospora sp. KI3]